MFTTIKAWLWVLPYAVIALCVAAIFYYRFEMAEASARAALTQVQLDSVVATNGQQQKTINALIDTAKIKDQIVSDLADKVADINDSVTANNKALDDLKTSDPDVKTFTVLPVPDALKRLHNKP
jgi:LysB family phage lysis regulatory protein